MSNRTLDYWFSRRWLPPWDQEQRVCLSRFDEPERTFWHGNATGEEFIEEQVELKDGPWMRNSIWKIFPDPEGDVSSNVRGLDFDGLPHWQCARLCVTDRSASSLLPNASDRRRHEWRKRLLGIGWAIQVYRQRIEEGDKALHDCKYIPEALCFLKVYRRPKPHQRILSSGEECRAT